MAQTPANRILTQLREREAARAVRDAAVKAAHDAYFETYPPRVEALLNDAAELAGLDEREPEPVRAPRKPRAPKPDTTLLPIERVTEFLALPVSAFAEAIHDLTLNALRQLRIGAANRKLVAHVATIDGEIGARG
jgi:hypothetical protein